MPDRRLGSMVIEDTGDGPAVVMDTPESGSGASPMALLLMGTAGCTAMDVIKEATRSPRRAPPLEVTEQILARLRGELDTVCPKGLEHTLDYLSRLVATRSRPTSGQSI